MEVLVVEALGKRFGAREVFRGLTFALGRGDALVVLGRNGSGKSTLLRILAGLLPPSQGSVQWPPGDPRLTIGWSSLDLAVYPHLTVRENLFFAARLRACEPRCEELAAQLGLAERLDQHARELSTGLRNRLKIAIAVQARPTILLLDEPSASLDADGRSAIESVCLEQRERGVLVLATNDPGERRLANLELELGG